MFIISKYILLSLMTIPTYFQTMFTQLRKQGDVYIVIFHGNFIIIITLAFVLFTSGNTCPILLRQYIFLPIHPQTF